MAAAAAAAASSPAASTGLTLVANAAQLVCVARNGERAKAGAAMNALEIIPNGALVVSENGVIEAVGTQAEIDRRYAGTKFARVVDATGCSVVPGLVDTHTHAIFAGDRCSEFGKKLAGATYMQIYNEGGGIHFTVRHVREASTEALCEALVSKLDRMLRTGTTVAEVKSGYGLDLDTEVKMLKVVELARGRSPVHLLSTYLAHSVPKGRTAAEVTKEIVESHFPVIKRLMDQGEIRPAFVDVFCEKGVFELEDTRKILAAGAQIGLALNFHGDELSPIRAAELAAEMKAASVAHLEHISDEGIEALAKHGVVGVLLPTTAYVLRIPYPPARRMIDRGVAVALGSDFNPNAWCFSLPFVMNLACVQMRLTLSEALVACTLNAAAALNCSKEYGSLEVGKRADFLVLSEPLWEHLVYRMCDPPIRGVYKGGRAVHGH